MFPLSANCDCSQTSTHHVSKVLLHLKNQPFEDYPKIIMIFVKKQKTKTNPETIVRFKQRAVGCRCLDIFSRIFLKKESVADTNRGLNIEVPRRQSSSFKVTQFYKLLSSEE